MRARLISILTALVVTIGLAVGMPAPAAAANPSPTAPRQVVFEAGTHTGYHFDASGAITASKSASLSRPSGASATSRSHITGRGIFLFISNGIWAGYWIRESMVAYLAGEAGQVSYAPPQRVAFPGGTVAGYRFDAAWKLTSARIGTLSRASGADATGLSVINGRRYYRILNGGWAGTYVPAGTTGSVTGLDCRTGTRASGGQQVLRTVSGAGPEVALTFDMGGRLDPALDIMRYLLLHGVCTTIFPTGAASQTATGAAVLAMVKAYPQIFEVGNHTMNHCNLVSGGEGAACPATRPSTTRLQKELTDAAAIIAAGSGQSPIPYWRPPYGAYDSAVLSAAAAIGYTKTAMWGVDTIDWKPVADGGPTAPGISTKVVGQAQNGTIVLMHLGGYNTRNALPAIIYGLRASRHLALTSISDVLDLT